MGRTAIAEFALSAARLVVPWPKALVAFALFEIGTARSIRLLDPVRRSIQIATLPLRATATRAIMPPRETAGADAGGVLAWR